MKLSMEKEWFSLLCYIHASGDRQVIKVILTFLIQYDLKISKDIAENLPTIALCSLLLHGTLFLSGISGMKTALTSGKGEIINKLFLCI